MNRSTTEIPKDMFKSLKTISLSLAALLLGASSACGQQSDSYAHKVNTLIGTRGVGLTSGYLYPGATYPFGMVQFTPTYFAKRGGFVINQLSGGGSASAANRAMPATTKPPCRRRSRRGSPSPSARAWPAMNTPRERRSAP